MPSFHSALTDPALFGRHFADASFAGWITLSKVISGQPVSAFTPSEKRFLWEVTRRAPFDLSLHDLWMVVGRRGGKSRFAAAIALYLSCFRDWRKVLSAGEQGTGMIICPDRRQGRVVRGYILGFISSSPLLKSMVSQITAEAIHFKNGVSIEVHTASYRTVRGYSITFAILARKGALWQQYSRHFGKESDSTLVVQAASRLLNPTIPESLIDEAMESDPAAAKAEWMAEFRRDIESFASLESIAACTILGRVSLPPINGVRYTAFVDPSGGSSDSFTLGIAHRQKDGTAVLDLVLERKPPFSPEAVVKEFCQTLGEYHVREVRGDRYAGEWPREQFRKLGIDYRPSDESKSEIYLSLLPLLNSGQVELLDNKRLLSQLQGLERRTSRGGRDSIDHGPGGHDDLVNAAAGVLVQARSARRMFLQPRSPAEAAGANPLTHFWDESIRAQRESITRAQEQARRERERQQQQPNQPLSIGDDYV